MKHGKALYNSFFSIRGTKITKDGKAPIEISISANGERVYFNSGKKINPNDWNKQKQAVKGKSDEAVLINDYLTQARNRIFQKDIELLKKGFIITANLLKDAYLDKIESLNKKTLFNVFSQHNEEQKVMVGNGIFKTTYWISEYTVRLLKEFI